MMKDLQVDSCAAGSPEEAGGLLISAALLRKASGAMDVPAAPLGPPPLEQAGLAADERAVDEELLNNVVSSPCLMIPIASILAGEFHPVLDWYHSPRLAEQ